MQQIIDVVQRRAFFKNNYNLIFIDLIKKSFTVTLVG